MENKKKVSSKMGRPIKEKDKLSTSINLKLTEEDYKSVKEKAEQLGMRATQYAREMTLKGGIKSRFTLEELDLMRKLSGMANNLNQVAKKAHIDGFQQAGMNAYYLFCEIKNYWMIVKNIKGQSFKGCVQYVMHEGAELLEAEGILANSTRDIIRSFAMQRSGRKEIKQPVGHIPISFAPEDKFRMTNEFMLQLAKEYMLEMGIENTQYIIVRHHNTDNDHLHIVYNRIDNNLKLISVNHDYKRNIKVCKRLKDKYNLTYGKGKDNVKREKLDNPDKIKYYIHDAIKSVLPQCKNPADLRFALQKFGIELEYKHKRATREIEGVSFRCENIAFKGSQVDRRFSFGNLKKEFEQNILALQNSEQKEHIKEEKQPTISTPKVKINPRIGGIELRNEQVEILKSGDYIYLKNMTNPQNGKQFSAYIVTDDQFQKAFFFNEPPDAFIKYGKYEMRLIDKKLIEEGFVTKAKVKWYGGGFAYPYLWKNEKLNEGYKESWRDPRETKSTKINTMEYEINAPKKNKRLKR